MELRDLQLKELDILKECLKIFQKYNLRYFMLGGTFLGAVRHRGFIPWDDDIDIFMTRDDYETFLSIMDQQKNDKFKCLHYGKEFPNYFYRFAKVVDLETTLQEGNFISHKDMGIFVDVFPADGIDIKKAEKHVKKIQYYSSMIIRSATNKITRKDNPSLPKYLSKKILYPFIKLIGWKYWLKKHEKFVKSKKIKDYEYATLYSGGWGMKEIFPKSYLNDTVYLDFEGHKFPAFKEYDKHLTHLYGDYMTPPPPEKQITHHDFKIYKK